MRKQRNKFDATFVVYPWTIINWSWSTCISPKGTSCVKSLTETPLKSATVAWVTWKALLIATMPRFSKLKHQLKQRVAIAEKKIHRSVERGLFNRELSVQSNSIGLEPRTPSLTANSIFHQFVWWRHQWWRHSISVKNVFIIEEQLDKSIWQLVEA